MSTLLYIGVLLLVVLLAGGWVVQRARRIRREAQAREMEALALVAAGGGGVPGETIFLEAGAPSRMPARGGIEVAEMAEVVDLDALLAGEADPVAERARARLEEPTNINQYGGLDTLPPRPLMPQGAPVPPPIPAPTPARPMPRPAAPQAVTPPAARPAAPVAPQPAAARPPVQPVPAQAAAAPKAAPKAAPIVVPPPPAPSPARPGEDVPLRELALAWFEARGYRSSPASSAVRPIELVLRHKNDPARAYAFVVESSRVSIGRVEQLRGQARSIGLVRLLIVAAGGAEPNAAEGFKGVRLMDRRALEGEFRQLDLPVAAKIIAVARKRATLAMAAAH